MQPIPALDQLHESPREPGRRRPVDHIVVEHHRQVEDLARLDPARVGDVIKLNDRELRIVAITHGNKSFTTPFVYVSRRTFTTLGGASEQVSFVVVRVAAGVDQRGVVQDLLALAPTIAVVPAPELRAATEVILAGRELYHLADHELSRVRCTQIGYIFQSFNLLNFLTVQQNVEVVLRLAGRGGRQVAERAHMVLSQVHLERRLGFAPEQLSGGERQRVSIARALANAPRLILADEPTGNLDSVNGQQIGALLREFAHQGGAAVVVVPHDQRLEPIADRRLYVEDGAIREAAVVSPPAVR
jgi:putative ABC transport system ATP-binding protein